MIETLVPASACAEMFTDAPESTMFSSEAAAVAGAVAERRREFGTVRYCARRALRQIRVPAVPILPDGDRAPRWPVGVVGSMTHCAGYRAAAVARSGDLAAVGIDAEPHAALPGETLDLVLRDEERARLLVLADARPDLHWDRILFSAKEAVYKAWFPLTRRWLDFADVSTTLHLDGTFRASLRGPKQPARPAAQGWASTKQPARPAAQGWASTKQPARPAAQGWASTKQPARPAAQGWASVAGVDLDGFSGRWVVGRGLVLAATSVGPMPGSSTP
jgi:4'-phosphopantetheinyl transferase EntD